MKKIIIPALLVFAFGFVSCESNLDIPQKGTVSTSDYYANDADAEAALADMYASFVQNVAGSEGIDNPEQVIINYSADDILAAGGDKEDHIGFRVFDIAAADLEGDVVFVYGRDPAALRIGIATRIIIAIFIRVFKFISQRYLNEGATFPIRNIRFRRRGIEELDYCESGAVQHSILDLCSVFIVSYANHTIHFLFICETFISG